MPSEYIFNVLHPEAEEIAGSKMAAKIANAGRVKALADLEKVEYTTFVTGAILTGGLTDQLRESIFKKRKWSYLMVERRR